MNLKVKSTNNILKNALFDTSNMDETSVIMHDLKNYLFIINGFMSMGDYETAQSKLQDLCEKMSHCKTENNDIISNSVFEGFIKKKLLNMRSRGISTTCNIESIKLDSHLESDLCIILGNALDNACEACEKIKSTNIEKIISLKVSIIDNNLCLVIKNTTDSIINVVNDKIVTCKKDFKRHGLGLKIIKSKVDDYHGDLNISQVGNNVSLNIIIPLN